jgi:hypothetical protein
MIDTFVRPADRFSTGLPRAIGGPLLPQAGRLDEQTAP